MNKGIDTINWDFIGAKSSLINSIHSYPAKFIPEIPNTLIDYLDISDSYAILDPFCGSGVTLQCAQEHHIPSVGIDLNPIACLISRVKTSSLPEHFLESCLEIVDRCKSRFDIPTIPEFSNRDHWFNLNIQYALAYLIEEIDKHREPLLNDALRFCFSSIITKVSNQDSDTRYAYKNKGKSTDDVYSFFLASAKKLIKAKSGNTYDTPVNVINKNSLLITKQDLPAQIGCVITSPPYPNAYEYWLYHKFRMIWLGFDPQAVKKQEIGTRSNYFKGKIVDPEIYDFANQINTLLSLLYEKLIDNAFVCFVIGRSKIHGQIYNNDEIISSVAERIGYKHVNTYSRSILSSRKSFNLSHARIKEEFIVILQKI